MYSSAYGGGYSSYPSGFSGVSLSSYSSPRSPTSLRYNSSRYANVSIYPTPVNYSRSGLPPPSRGTTVSRGNSLPPAGQDSRASRQRTAYRSDRPERTNSADTNRNLRLKSPSIPRERTRDELIDSIVHTRTREHRAMPGFRSSTDYDERKSMRVDCDKVFNGIIIGNGETIKNINYLQGIGVTHVLNTAEGHACVNPAKFSCHGIQYYGFHVDDLPESNISRYFHRTSDFIHKAVSGGGLVVVNCHMGWSRSATCVAAYLMMKHNMTSTRALETIRQSRPIRPNAGFLQQLADLENTLAKRISWY
jgi:protein-tyrosine phosphatase